MKRFFHISRWLHKYVGLLLILFLMWMSVSGVLMNHPHLIAGASVPGWLVPGHYLPDNWNRSAITSVVFERSDSSIAYLGGKIGVYRSVAGRVDPEPLSRGFPDEAFYAKTNHLFMHGQGANSSLFAATDGGLYRTDTSTETWERIPLGTERARVVKLLETKDALHIFTDSDLFTMDLSDADSKPTPVHLEREGPQDRVSKVKLFFDLHGGEVWGLPGRLLFDLAGVVLFYLSFSAFYAWYYPRKLKQRRTRGKPRPAAWQGGLFRFIHKYHLKLGIWVAAILLLIGGTGLFMRPPLLAVLMGDVPRGWYPGPLPENAWESKIQNALHDSVNDKFIIQASDGLWQAPADLSVAFREIELPTPIFVMGATVFDADDAGRYSVGSFGGLYDYDPATGDVTDRLNGEQAPPVSVMRPAELMITASFRTPDGTELINTHEGGLMRLDGGPTTSFGMPEQIRSRYRMPLWNYLFEIHNGRFFKGWIGEWYILIVPLGALLFLLVTISGVYDWLYKRLPGGRRIASRPSSRPQMD